MGCTGCTAAAAACWDSLALRPPAIRPLIRTMCCHTKSKQLRIHWSSFQNIVYILSNHAFRTAVSIWSSSAVVVVYLIFISASLYAFIFLLNRHSLAFSHSITLSSWSPSSSWTVTVTVSALWSGLSLWLHIWLRSKQFRIRLCKRWPGLSFFFSFLSAA